MVNHILHKNDLDPGVVFGGIVGIDCEMMGLDLHRDRLCVMQMFDPMSGKIHIVQFNGDAGYAAPNLCAVLKDPDKLFIGHMIRLDLGWVLKYLGVLPENIYCTRTASRLTRTFGASHELKDIVPDILGVKIDKSETYSDWGAETLTSSQIQYACDDVIYLPALKEKLDVLLRREGRADLMCEIMKTLPVRVRMDVAGWWGEDILNFPF